MRYIFCVYSVQFYSMVWNFAFSYNSNIVTEKLLMLDIISVPANAISSILEFAAAFLA